MSWTISTVFHGYSVTLALSIHNQINHKVYNLVHIVYNLTMTKTYVEVTAKFDVNGTITPLKLVFDNTTYVVDKVVSSKLCASFKVGGIGVRYLVKINGFSTYLFLENNRWFVEQKTP